MIDLSTTFSGAMLKNVLIAASGPPTHDPDTCERIAKAGFGAVVLKTGRTDVPESRMCKVGSPMVKLLDLSGRYPWKAIPPKSLLPKYLGKKAECNPITVRHISFKLRLITTMKTLIILNFILRQVRDANRMIAR